MRRRTTSTTKRKRTTTKGKRNTRNWISSKYGYTVYKQRVPQTVPDSMYVCLTWSDVTDSVTAATTTNDLMYRANSCFAPSLASARQPNGYDQFAAFYMRYRVYASSIDVSISTTSSTIASIFCVVPNADSTLFTSINDGMEAVRNKNTKWFTENGNTSMRIKHYATTQAILGLTRREMDDDTTAALVASQNPTKIWYWHTIVHCVGSTLTYCAQVKINYYVEFYQRVALSAS